MTVNRKIIFPALAMALVGGAASVKAQSSDAASPENVLFKIHDVQSVKNADGVINACDYNITFYNRSPRQLKSATLNLNWMDNSIASIITEEKKEEKKKSGRNYSKTEEVDSAALSTSVDVPTLEPYKQVTIRSRLQSDKCFLMLSDVNFSVKSCNIADNTDGNAMRVPVNNRNSGAACDGVFKFVPSTDPEYYRDFKPVSYEEDRRQGENQRMNDRRLINTKYDEVVSEMNKISSTLDEIKADSISSDGEVAASTSAVAETTPAQAKVSDEELSAKLKTLFPGLGEPAGSAANPNGNSSANSAAGGAANSGGSAAGTDNNGSAGNGTAAASGSTGDAGNGMPVSAGGTLKDALNNASGGAGSSSGGAGNGGNGNVPENSFGDAEMGISGSPSAGKTEYNSPNVK